MLAWMDRFQVPLYLAAIAAGLVLAVGMPSVAGPAGDVVTPVLGLLIFVTFLGVPVQRLGPALRDGRFLATLLVVNFVFAPAVAWLCTRFVTGEPGLLIGAVLVLVCPCVDYVMVFTGLAGGDRERLLAASPLLMLVQICLVPLWLWWFVGPDAVGAFRVEAFVSAYVWLILVPLAAAWGIQAVARSAGRRDGAGSRLARAGQVVMLRGEQSMVALMMLTLAVVARAHGGAVARRWESLWPLLPVYVGFAVVMVGIGWIVGSVAGLARGSRIAVVFSGVTRNSLVVLPLALSWGSGESGEGNVAAIAVVAQTLVELIIMVVMVRMVPVFVRGDGPKHRPIGSDAGS